MSCLPIPPPTQLSIRIFSSHLVVIEKTVVHGTRHLRVVDASITLAGEGGPGEFGVCSCGEGGGFHTG